MKSLIAGIVSVLFVLASVACGSDITYELVNYPADQIDASTGLTDTMSGNIITDGMVGNLSASDAISWSIEINGQRSLAFSGTGATFAFDGSGSLMATATQLIMEPGDVLYLSGENNNGPDNSLLESQFGFYDYDPTIYEPVASGYVYNNLTRTYLVNWSTPPSWAPPSPWIIAQTAPTPEPSTLALLGTCVIGLIGYRLRWKRVARTAQPVDAAILPLPSHSFHQANLPRRAA